MRIALVADTYPPLRNSGAIQLRDLSREFIQQGHSLTVILPSSTLKGSWILENYEGVRILRIKTFNTKDIGYVGRTFAELAMPFFMLLRYKKSPLKKAHWDGVIWYSPSIFHGPFISFLKKSSKCKGYLIVRDIFPQWAFDMGLIKRGLPFFFFDLVARYQYSIANIIGVQTPGNKSYFMEWLKGSGRSLEVLSNWLGKPSIQKCSIRISQTKLAGRKVFIYAGNMGIAQGVDCILDIASRFNDRKDVGFLFVGRGSEFCRLKKKAHDLQIENTLFFDEISPDEIYDLYSQCSAGIVTLDPRHKSHNIPGKFLTYMQSGLPVLASVNKGNDLVKIIKTEKVGMVSDTNDLDELVKITDKLLEKIASHFDYSARCIRLFNRDFTATKAVKQIVLSLSS